MQAFEETKEWLMGDKSQQRWAHIVADRGGVVLPTYGMQEVDATTKAPVLFHKDGILVVPDLLVMSKKNPPRWHEVKAKTCPTWRRFYPGPRWEHGIDYSLMKEYQEVERISGSKVVIVVHESASPVNPKEIMVSEQDDLKGEEKWLWMSLDKCRAVGQARPKWPGGNRRSRRNEGGWLWARAEMNEFADATSRTVVELK